MTLRVWAHFVFVMLMVGSTSARAATSRFEYAALDTVLEQPCMIRIEELS